MSCGHEKSLRRQTFTRGRVPHPAPEWNSSYTPKFFRSHSISYPHLATPHSFLFGGSLSFLILYSGDKSRANTQENIIDIVNIFTKQNPPPPKTNFGSSPWGGLIMSDDFCLKMSNLGKPLLQFRSNRFIKKSLIAI